MYRELKLRIKQVIYEPQIKWQHKKAKAARYSARELKSLCVLPESSTDGLGSRRERCWSYAVSVFENTPKNLVVRGRAQLEYNSHTVTVCIEATC